MYTLHIPWYGDGWICVILYNTIYLLGVFQPAIPALMWPPGYPATLPPAADVPPLWPQAADHQPSGQCWLHHWGVDTSLNGNFKGTHDDKPWFELKRNNKHWGSLFSKKSIHIQHHPKHDFRVHCNSRKPMIYEDVSLLRGGAYCTCMPKDLPMRKNMAIFHHPKSKKSHIWPRSRVSSGQ